MGIFVFYLSIIGRLISPLHTVYMSKLTSTMQYGSTVLIHISFSSYDDYIHYGTFGQLCSSEYSNMMGLCKNRIAKVKQGFRKSNLFPDDQF